MKSSCPLNSFEEDLLHREDLADYLSVYIKTTLPAVNTNSLVLALNSSWGTGKTSFINMWIDKLKKTPDEYNIITYNAWENDDCPEAIVPLICSFNQLGENDPAKTEKMKNKIISVLKILGPRVINSVAWGMFHIDVNEITQGCSDLMESTSSETIYDEYTTLNKKKEAFRELVREFASEEKPLLIFVDELDRCRPTFAIETLEAVKHFFDLKNVIFVFSIDIEQLRHSIKTIYGEIECVGYLQRFFDYQIRLPSPNFKEYLRERLVYDGTPLGDQVDHLSTLAERLKLSLRALNVICEAYLRFITQKRYISDSIFSMRRPGNIYISLIALKYSDPVRYIDVIQNGIEITDQNDKFMIELFGTQKSTIDEWKSFYTKEVAQTPVRNIISSSSLPDNLCAAKDYLLFDPEIRQYKYYFSNITISQAVFNNVEYGSMVYPIPK